MEQITDFKAAYRYTLYGNGRNLGIASNPYVVEADSLKAAIRIARAKRFTKAWSLALRKIEHISSGAVVWKRK